MPDDAFPLTDIQHAYWVGRNRSCELGGVGMHFYEEVAVRALDVARLSAAWRAVVARHDMLRAVVRSDGTQQILDAEAPAVTEHDLRSMSPPQRRGYIARWRERHSHQVFAPNAWPGFLLHAARLTDTDWRVVISLDGLHIDLESAGIVFNDCADFYTNGAFRRPPPPDSYRDYVRALARLEETERYHEAAAYWKTRVPSLPPSPRLPARCELSALPLQHVSRLQGAVDARAWAELKGRARAAGLTPPGLLLAVYGDVLLDWSEGFELLINVTVMNRLPVQPHVHEIAGNFTSMVPLAVARRAGDTFTTGARAAQEQLLRDLRYREFSGVRVMRDLARLRGGVAGAAVAPVVFTSGLNLPSRGLVALGRLGRRVYSRIQTPQVALDLQVFDECGGLRFNWDWVRNLYSGTVMRDMCGEWRRRLLELAAGRRWHDLSGRSLPPAQRHRRALMNATDGPVPNTTLDALFTAAARAHAQRPAVIAPDRTLTYADLDRLARGTAAELLRNGSGAERPIAIAIEKGWRQPVAVMGTLIAGSPYVPIDPSWPQARVHQLVAHAGVELVLTSPASLPLRWPHGVRVMCLDDVAESGQTCGRAPHTSSGLAYILYTSGSTGVPKGVMVEHRSVVNRMRDVNARFGVTASDRVFSLTALHHDLSVYDMFGMLSIGGALVFGDSAGLTDPAHWAHIIRTHRPTIWNSVPAYMDMLLGHLESERVRARLDAFRLVLLSGDWVPTAMPRRIHARLPGARVISLGGPTETTVWDVCHPVRAGDDRRKSIPYGRPMRNAKYFVLDERGGPCPDEVAGELYLAGVGLARGYVRDPERTAADFVSHPVTGERLYRSGDLGRVLDDGTIEFLGRKDFQVKVRGQRIDLCEIEDVVRRHAGVREAVVTVAGQSAADQHLVAYVARADSGSRDGCDWRSRLAAATLKVSRPGLRRDLDGSTSVPLDTRKLVDDITHAPQRYTCRQFAPDAVPTVAFGGLLATLASVEGDVGLPKYRYPSAGSLYAVQTYVHVKPARVVQVPEGLYYYRPDRHALVPVSNAPLPRSMHVSTNQQASLESAFTIFLVAALAPVREMYGERAREFCVLESGCMLQLLMGEAPAHGIGLCPIGELDVDGVGQLLRLDEDSRCVHAMLGGVPLPQTRQVAPAAKGLSGEELRAFLEQHVPAHMRPTAYVFLDALPLNGNGKIDRKALPPPGQDAYRRAPQRPPITTTEKRLADIVREVIAVPDVGADDRFFDLGASSLHLVHLLARVNAAFEKDIGIMQLLEHGSVARLAQLVVGTAVSDAQLVGRSRAEQRRRQVRARERAAVLE